MSLYNSFDALENIKALNKKKAKKAKKKEPEPASTGKQPFDYYMVLDFEATCEKDDPNYPHEIIEFPVVVVDGKTGNVGERFHEYVKPMKNKTLTEFCTKLTGITQEQVDKAMVLDDVLKKCHDWLTSLGMFKEGVKFTFATDGPWDFRDFYWNHAVSQQHAVSTHYAYYENWVDIRSQFSSFAKTRCNVENMLKHFGLRFEGRPHSGIDDTYNIARILVALMQNGVVMKQNGSVAREVLNLHLARIGVLNESAKKQVFTHIVPIHFHATCDEDATDYPHEVIKITASIIKTTGFETVGLFSEFVRPEKNAVLTDFCKQYTKVSQADVDTADTINTTMMKFHEWLCCNGVFNNGASFTFVVDSPWCFDSLLWKCTIERNKQLAVGYKYLQSWCDIRDMYRRLKMTHKKVRDMSGDFGFSDDLTMVEKIGCAAIGIMKGNIVFSDTGNVNKRVVQNHHSKIKRKGTQSLKALIVLGVEDGALRANLISVENKKVVDTFTASLEEISLFVDWAAPLQAPLLSYGRTLLRLASMCPSPIFSQCIEVSRIPTYGAFSLAGSIANVLAVMRIPEEPTICGACTEIVLKLLHNNVRIEVNTGY
eukprot:TRINITY_DN28051_c0_g1_i1.p1 TRINITY_DN28051_c0_g1~~TRINITY_DN28051_c0_g1_i1.p1  ORF type:complete len:615 (+),score=136.72 TRINITY_DN28051_c0_g1_i1:57-1847(+)